LARERHPREAQRPRAYTLIVAATVAIAVVSAWLLLT